MFLGGTIVSHPNNGRVAVCGHSWTNEFYYKTENHQINPSGSCFIINFQNNLNKTIGIFALSDKNLQYKYSTYFYSHAMTGFSAAFTENGDNLLLGAPGFYQWRGTILETNDINYQIDNSFVKEKFLLQNQRYYFETESYFGYSIVSGHFLAGIQTSIAIGAPRDLNYRGRVYVYNLSNSRHSEETTLMYSHMDGSKLGEYFGASLLAVNLNNDAYTDLIIGAPFYTQSAQVNGDRGRVYIFISNGNGFNEPQILSGSDAPFSRFGTSIANLGDINFDGYNDIAIGSPYEDGVGSVYIYNGGRNGVRIPYYQRISAKEHFSGIDLNGFGISISGNRDVDSNQYNDILIGSYLSEKAILLRTKPIAVIEAVINLDNDRINVNDKKCPDIGQTNSGKLVPCVKLSFCIKYNGSHVPLSQKLNVSIIFDNKMQENPRCFTRVDNREMNSISEHVTLVRDSQSTCFGQYVIYLRNTTHMDEVFTPIEFALYYDLIPSKPENQFCSQCPITFKNEKIAKQLYFETGCSLDEKCISNLKLRARLQSNNNLIDNNGSILEGFNDNLNIRVYVHNYGEPSYLTKLLVNTEPEFNILKQDSRCTLSKANLQKSDNNYIECDVGNPLEKESQQEINIPFDISQIDIGIDKIQVFIRLKTSSDITPDSEMSLNLTLNVVRNASVQIVGNSLKSEVLYEDSNNREKDFVQFSGLFQIIKQNSSTVETTFIEIFLPSYLKGRSLIFRPKIEIIKGVSVNCNRSISALPVLPLITDSGNKYSSDSSDKKSISKTSIKRKRSVDGVKASEIKSTNSLILDCKSEIECYKLECYAGPFKPDKQIAQFIIHSAINLTSIEAVYGKKYQTIELIFDSSAIILDQKIPNTQLSTHSISFLFKKVNIKDEKIEKWIIFISVGVGLLILILIVIVLIKIGFFRRKKKEEMENMANESDVKRESGSLLDINEIGFENDLKNYESEQDLSDVKN